MDSNLHSARPFSQERFNSLQFASTSKLTPDNWHHNNASILRETNHNNVVSQHNRVATDHEDRVTRARIAQEQEHTRQTLVTRLHDINNWQRRLEKEIEMAKDELAKQTKNRERCYFALDATEIPMSICQDNLITRNRREDTDQVCDNVEVQMLAEKEHLLTKQAMLEELHRNCVAMEQELKQRIEELQHDWSRKKIANQADTFCGNLHNNSNFLQGQPDGTNTDRSRNVDSWRVACEENIRNSQMTRQSSSDLRNHCANAIQAEAIQSRKHNDIVNRALQARIYETIQQKRCLETTLAETDTEFLRLEKNAIRLNTALKDIIAPYQVNLTRRSHRNEQRPGDQENLTDPCEYQLLLERENLDESQKMMLDRLDETQKILKELQAKRDLLRKEIRVKTLSLQIDQKDCVPRRASYPSESVIMGWMNGR